MPLLHPNDIVANSCAGLEARYVMDAGWATNRVAVTATTPTFNIVRAAYCKSVPSGLSWDVMPTKLWAHSSVSAPFLFGRLIDLGSLNIATPTFTDGDAMPTRTILGSSQIQAGAVIVEVTSALNATPGSYQVTYTDQDGNTGQTSTSLALSASCGVGSCGLLPLASGDWGVRDITAATRTGGTTPSGTLRFWGLIDPVLFMGSAAVVAAGEDLINDGLIYRYPSGAKMGLFQLGSVAAHRTIGSIQLVGDA